MMRYIGNTLFLTPINADGLAAEKEVTQRKARRATLIKRRYN